MTLDSILLLSCRSPFLDDAKIYAPMANLYLKSFIEKELPGVRVGIGDDDYDLEDVGWAEPWKAVGISIMTPQRDEALKILRSVKRRYPDKMLVAGGPHCRHYADDAIKEPWDHIVPLDGEKALVSILQGKAERVVRHVMTKQDIHDAPRPDRQSPDAVKAIRNYHYTLQGRMATTMMTGRGCPEQCTFCEDAMTSIKWSSLDNLRQEMDDVKILGYRGVYIFDDLFAIAMPKVQPICEELKKRDLWYRCNGQARYFTKWGEDFAALLGTTGCKEIAFGHESGSQRILDNIKKRTTVQQNYDSIKYAKKHGIKVKSFMMLGLPGEDRESVAATEKFIAEAGMDDFQLVVYYPYKGTQIRDAIDRGDASMDIAFMGEGLGAYGQYKGGTEAVVRTSALTQEELLKEQDRIVRKYKPKSHTAKWSEDKFFETRMKEEKP